MILGDFKALEDLKLNRKVFRVATSGGPGRGFINFSAGLEDLVVLSMKEPMNLQVPCASREYLQVEQKILTMCPSQTSTVYQLPCEP